MRRNGFDTRERALAQAGTAFAGVVRRLWRGSSPERLLDRIALVDTRPEPRALAALYYKGTPHAIGDVLIRSASEYELRLSDRLLAMDEPAIERVLIHEAAHLGYANHGRAFRELVREHGGAVSEFATEAEGVAAQRKEGARYQTVRTFLDEDEAIRWVKEQLKLGPAAHWRIKQ